MANYLSLEEAAQRLGISTERLVELRSRGDISGYRDGQSWKFKPEEVARMAAALAQGSDLELSLGAGDSELSLAPLEDSDVDLGAELKGLAGSGSGGSDVLGGLEAGRSGSTDPAAEKPSSGSLNLGGELELADDDDDDLMLGAAGSDIALAADSGISLSKSGSDSGLVLEEIAGELGSGSGVGLSGLDLADAVAASSSGSMVDFQADEEFQLSPSGGIDADEDSGSQVIELEDSSEFGDLDPMAGGLDPFGEGDVGADDGLGLGIGAEAPAAMVGRSSSEVPYTNLQVAGLLTILLVFCLNSLVLTDIIRNMWSWSGSESSLTGAFTDSILSGLGMSKRP